MSAHTPGPWHVEDGFSVVGTRRTVTEYFVRRDGQDIAIAADILDPETGEPSEANARLIAAAPSLLDALEAAEKWIVAHDEDPVSSEPGDCDCSYCKMLASIRAALRAAKEPQA